MMGHKICLSHATPSKVSKTNPIRWNSYRVEVGGAASQCGPAINERLAALIDLMVIY